MHATHAMVTLFLYMSCLTAGVLEVLCMASLTTHDVLVVVHAQDLKCGCQDAFRGILSSRCADMSSAAGAGSHRKRGWEEMVKEEPISGDEQEEVEVEVPVEEGNDSWWWDGKWEQDKPEGSYGVQDVKEEASWWADTNTDQGSNPWWADNADQGSHAGSDGFKYEGYGTKREKFEDRSWSQWSSASSSSKGRYARGGWIDPSGKFFPCLGYLMYVCIYRVYRVYKVIGL